MDVDRARDVIATEVPRRLRLDELLRELGAHDGDVPPDRAAGITVGELVDKAAEAGFGFLIGGPHPGRDPVLRAVHAVRARDRPGRRAARLRDGAAARGPDRS